MPILEHYTTSREKTQQSIERALYVAASWPHKLLVAMTIAISNLKGFTVATSCCANDSRALRISNIFKIIAYSRNHIFGSCDD